MSVVLALVIWAVLSVPIGMLVGRCLRDRFSPID